MGFQKHVPMHGDLMPQCSIQFACIRFVFFLCVEDPIGLGADFEILLWDIETRHPLYVSHVTVRPLLQKSPILRY